MVSVWNKFQKCRIWFKNCRIRSKKCKIWSKKCRIRSKKVKLDLKNVELDFKNVELDLKNIELDLKDVELDLKRCISLRIPYFQIGSCFVNEKGFMFLRIVQGVPLNMGMKSQLLVNIIV